MNRYRCGWLLLAGIGWLAAAEVLSAQLHSYPESPEKHKSHIPLPPGSGTAGDAERMLKERLGRHKDLHEAHELLQRINKDPGKYFSKDEIEQFKHLMQSFEGGTPGSNTIDEETLRFFQKWAKRQKESSQKDIPHKQLDNLERILEEHARSNPGTRPGHPSKPNTNPQTSPPTPPPSNLPTPSPDQMKDVRSRQRMLDFAERFLGRSGRDSDTLRRAEQDLHRQRLKQAEDWLQLGKAKEGLRSRLPDFSPSLRLDKVVREGEGLFRNRPSPPDIGVGRGNSGSSGGGYSGGGSSGGLPSVSPPSTGDGSGWQVLLWLVLGVALLAAFWKILGGLQKPDSAKKTGWRLGGWPVAPGAVSTRDELVRAFEYLTLLCLGPAARYWNHLEIASRLGGEESAGRQQAASELAGLYEQARYAPPDELLPVGELEVARRHLRYLAGVSVA